MAQIRIFLKNVVPLSVDFAFFTIMEKLFIVIGIVSIAVILLCIRVIVKKNGQFSSQHISENKRMKQDGIHCATSQDRETRRKQLNKLDIHQL